MLLYLLHYFYVIIPYWCLTVSRRVACSGQDVCDARNLFVASVIHCVLMYRWNIFISINVTSSYTVLWKWLTNFWSLAVYLFLSKRVTLNAPLSVWVNLNSYLVRGKFLFLMLVGFVVLISYRTTVLGTFLFFNDLIISIFI